MPSPMQILQMEEFVMSVVMVISQTNEGDSQADAGRNRQENESEGDGCIGVGKVHGRECRGTCCRHRCHLFVVAVPQAKSDGCQTDAD